MASYYAPMRGYTINDTNITVLQPNPGKVPVTAGHWHRDTAQAKRKPAPRLVPTPTGGKVVRAKGVAQYPRKRKSSATPAAPSARALHAAWSKGKLDF